MKTVRDRSIRTSFPDALGSLAKDVLNQAANQVADRLAKDQDVSEFPDILTFEEWTEELTRGPARAMMAQFVPLRINNPVQHCFSRLNKGNSK